MSIVQLRTFVQSSNSTAFFGRELRKTWLTHWQIIKLLQTKLKKDKPRGVMKMLQRGILILQE